MSARDPADVRAASVQETEQEKLRARAAMERRKERAARIKDLIGIVLLALTFGWSIVHVAWITYAVEGEVFGADKTVIRFAHWQLEGRTVEAMDEAAASYMELHPDVAVRQIEVPERAYEQWVRTQLIGRTAPDLIELRGETWDNLVVKYFVPIGEEVEEPNPYNKGTKLEGVPWRQTYIDSMKGGFREGLQDYYGMPLSIFTIRLFGNKTFLGKVQRHFGRIQPGEDFRKPGTLGTLLQLCRDVERYNEEMKAARGDEYTPVIPIAGSKYTANMFRNKYWVMGTWGLREGYDSDYDGRIGDGELLRSVYEGRLDLSENPYVWAAHNVLYDLTQHFNTGFVGTNRDQSVLKFTIGNAAMIATGSWDAGNLYKTVDGGFEIAVFDFPTARPENEKYGKYIAERVSEAGVQAGFPFGLTRFSQNRATAMDFMHYLTSLEVNERINRQFRWFPAIRGAEMDELLEPFEPKVRGVYQVFNIYYPGDTQLNYQQDYESFIAAGRPGRGEFRSFLKASKGRESTFVSEYGGLARRVLDKYGGVPEDYTYEQYLADWQQNHYKEFVETYENVFIDRRAGLEDFRRKWKTGYSSVYQTETGLAQQRARAIQQMMVHEPTDDVRNSLQSLTYGQVKRIMTRAYHLEDYEAVQQKLQESEGASG